MPSPISGKIRMEYTPGRGFHFPDTSLRGRAIYPSYADGGSYILTHSEPVTLSIPVGTIAANGSSTVTGSQQLNLASLNLSQYDVARVFFVNVSATGPANVIISHPQIYLSSNQGTLGTGVLAAGQDYTNLSMTATVPCYSIAGSSAGTITLTATMLCIGTQLG